MQRISYSDMVSKLAKSGKTIKEEMNLGNLTLLEYTMAVAVDFGEYADRVKKQIIYQKDKGIEVPEDCLPEEVLENLTAEQCHLMHMAMGKFGEAAEVLSLVYNHVFSGEPLALNEVCEELGDEEFYAEGFRQGLGIDRVKVLIQNYDKLYGGTNARYKEGYSDQAAQVRADKAE